MITACIVIGALALVVVIPIAIHNHKAADKEKPASAGVSVKWEDPEA